MFQEIMAQPREDDVNVIINRLTQLVQTQSKQLTSLVNQSGNGSTPVMWRLVLPTYLPTYEGSTNLVEAENWFKIMERMSSAG